MKNKTEISVVQIAQIGILTAMSFVLYTLEIPAGFLTPATPFLKIDFSDVPAFIATFGINPIAGVLVMLLKNILHLLLITKEPAASGELGNLLSGLCMIIPAWIILKKNQNAFRCFSAVIFSAVYCAVAMVLFNYFVTLPLYKIMDAAQKETMILYGFLPFNLLKGVVITTISILLYKLLKKTKVFQKNRNAI